MGLTILFLSNNWCSCTNIYLFIYLLWFIYFWPDNWIRSLWCRLIRYPARKAYQAHSPAIMYVFCCQLWLGVKLGHFRVWKGRIVPDCRCGGAYIADSGRATRELNPRNKECKTSCRGKNTNGEIKTWKIFAHYNLVSCTFNECLCKVITKTYAKKVYSRWTGSMHSFITVIASNTCNMIV